MVAALIGSFYDNSRANPSKDPWSIDNLKKYLNLGYVKLDDISKYRAAYLATLGDESIFADPIVQSIFPNDAAGESKLLDKHDGFSLKPKKLIAQYCENPGDSKAQSKLFVHMTNFVCTTHVTSHKKKSNGDAVQLEPTAGLDVEILDEQKRLLNPTAKDVQMGELIDQAQGSRAKKKEAKRRQNITNGNIGSYSAILNAKKNLRWCKIITILLFLLGC